MSKQNEKLAAGSIWGRVTKKAPSLPKYEDATPEGMKKGRISYFLQEEAVLIELQQLHI